MDDTIHCQSPAEAAQRAIAAAGGGARLASQVGVTRFAVQQWLRAGIPPARLPVVERITGIPMRELRPDLWPAPAEAA